MTNNKYHTVGTARQSISKIGKRSKSKKNTNKKQICEHSLSCLDTGTAIKR
jgi:hypothetical protein